MTYYDIHTHTASLHPEVVAIVNRILIEESTDTSVPLISVGIHPWYIKHPEEQIKCLKEIATLPAVVAIGEAGLDKLTHTPFDLQQEVFTIQAELAEKLQKPLIIHCVKAWQEIIAAKKQFRPTTPWIVHGFRGNEELASQLITHGFYLSFGERYNPKAVAVAWPKRIFAETDETMIDIRTVYQQISSSLQIDIHSFATQIKENVKKVFLI